MEILLNDGTIIAAHIEYGPTLACYVTEDGQRVSGEDAEPVFSPKLVARKLRVHEWQVRDWLRSGQMAGIKRSDGWRVRESDMAGFALPKRGRPRKAVSG